MSIPTLTDMRDKLLTLDQVVEQLQATEPVEDMFLSSGSAVKFNLNPGWEMELETTHGDAVVDATITVNGHEYQMTKDATLMAAANFGLTGAYVKKTPGPLIQDHLNYWYSGGMGDTVYNALLVDDKVSAFIRPSLKSFSNLELLTRAVDAIYARYGEIEILADYKFRNSIQKTDIRLVLPGVTRDILESGMADVPEGLSDVWSAGVHLSNSLVGKTQTAVDAYAFRWWCTNGSTETLTQDNIWKRKRGTDALDAYTWASESVDAVLGGMEANFDAIQALTVLDVEDNLPHVLSGIFTEHKFPHQLRQAVQNNLEISDDDALTMYTVMQAITSVANSENLDPDRADTLMRVGGLIPTSAFDSTKAQIWDEGNKAGSGRVNPYKIPSVVQA
jgi:hypothetical protein